MKLRKLPITTGIDMPKKSASKTPKQLLAENEDLRARLDEADEILSAIRSGEVDALVVSGDDGVKIFTLKQAEDALAESEGKFRQLVESLPSVVYMNEISDAGTTIYVSPQISAHMGYTPEEWLADPQLWSKSIHADDYQHVMIEANNTNRGNEIFDMEYRMITHAGRMVWVHDQSLLVHDLMGKPKFRQGIMLDITARKKAETNLQQIEDALRESEAHYQSIFKNSQDAILLTAPDGSIVDVNPATVEMFNRTAEEIKSVGRNALVDITDPRLAHALEERARTGKMRAEITMIRANGSKFPADVTSTIFANAHGEMRTSMIIRDITERIQAEDALIRSEKEFRGLAENALVGVFRSNINGQILFVNDSLARIYEYDSPAELIRENTRMRYKNAADQETVLGTLRGDGKIDGFEIEALTNTGDVKNILLSATLENDIITGIMMDITARKRAEEALRASEARLLEAQSAAKVGSWETDLSTLKVIWSAQTYEIFDLDRNTFQASHTAFLDFVHPDDRAKVDAAFVNSFNSKVYNAIEHRIVTATGVTKYVEEHWRIFRDDQEQPAWAVGTCQDITERKQAEQNLLESEEKYRNLIEHLPNVVYMNAVGDASTTIYVSPQIETLLGYTAEQWLADPKLWSQRLHPEDRQRVLEELTASDQKIKPFDTEYRMITSDDRTIWVHDQVTLVNDLKGQPQFWQGIMLDITERKQSETALLESNERFRQVWETTSDAMALSDAEGIILAENPAYLSLYGYRSEQVVGNSFAIIFPEENRKTAIQQYKTVFANELIPPTFESVIQRTDGTERTVESRISFLSTDGQRTAMLSTIRDITERKQADEKILRQIDYLTALQDIDRSITSTFDMHLSLKVLISKALTLLEVDAAVVFLVNLNTGSLEFVVGDGFRTNAFQTATIKVAQSYAGKAAMKRHIVKIPNLKDDAGNGLIPNYLTEEDFVGIYAVPLILNGKVIGVLEVLQRSLIKRNQEWLDFLNALAGQAAIAISNAQLFESLQHSNIELSQAYNATIEGWSHALDLRDKETEGHSLRVTEMTMNLARNFELSEDELIQVRWGVPAARHWQDGCSRRRPA